MSTDHLDGKSDTESSPLHPYSSDKEIHFNGHDLCQPLKIEKQAKLLISNPNLVSLKVNFDVEGDMPTETARAIASVLRSSTSLEHITIGPYGPASDPSQSLSAAWWTGGSLGSPFTYHSMGRMAMEELIEGVAHCPSSQLEVSLSLCSFDEYMACKMKSAIERRFQQDGRSTSLVILGGGLGYTMRCGMDYYYYTDLRPTLSHCLRELVGIKLDCFLNFQEHYILMSEIAHAERLESIALTIQSLDDKQFLLAKVAKGCPSLQKIVFKCSETSKITEVNRDDFQGEVPGISDGLFGEDGDY